MISAVGVQNKANVTWYPGKHSKMLPGLSSLWCTNNKWIKRQLAILVCSSKSLNVAGIQRSHQCDIYCLPGQHPKAVYSRDNPVSQCTALPPARVFPVIRILFECYHASQTRQTFVVLAHILRSCQNTSCEDLQKINRQDTGQALPLQIISSVFFCI